MNINWKAIAIGLIILMALGLLIYGGVQNGKNNYKIGFQNATNLTLQAVNNQLISLAFQCQQIPLTYRNQTIHLYPLECFNQTGVKK